MTTNSGIAADRLKSFIERIERLEEEKKAVAEDIKSIYTEAKGVGFDVKTMRKIIAARRIDAAEREEQAQIYRLYANALGMGDDMPVTSEVSVRDEDAIAAINLMKLGKSIRDTAAITGISRSQVQRLREAAKIGAVPENVGTPDHDPETGEIHEPEVGPTPPISSEPPAPHAAAAPTSAHDPWGDENPLPPFLNRRKVA